VERKHPEVVVIRNARNEGFAAGANAGALAAGSDRVVLLNNDAVPQEGWLERLLAALEPDDVAVASSVVEEARYPAAYALGTGTISLIGHPIPNVLPDPTAPFYASGTALAFKRALFPRPFEPSYFAYYEDVLLSWRARLRGYRVARALDSTVQHLGGATADRMRAAATFYWERNKALTLLVCFERGTLLRLLPLYAFDGAARLAEDVWHTIGPRRARRLSGQEVLRRYALVARAIGWLAVHRAEVIALRRSVQAERRLGDGAITRWLSGKTFDDFQPTLPHAVANLLALAYCRLVGIETADQLSR
jgi:GT2 family glycosyltransferase